VEEQLTLHSEYLFLRSVRPCRPNVFLIQCTVQLRLPLPHQPHYQTSCISLHCKCDYLRRNVNGSQIWFGMCEHTCMRSYWESRNFGKEIVLAISGFRQTASMGRFCCKTETIEASFVCISFVAIFLYRVLERANTQCF